MTAAVGDGIVPVWDSTTWELVAKLNHPSYVYRLEHYAYYIKSIKSNYFRY